MTSRLPSLAAGEAASLELPDKKAQAQLTASGDNLPDASASMDITARCSPAPDSVDSDEGLSWEQQQQHQSSAAAEAEPQAPVQPPQPADRCQPGGSSLPGTEQMGHPPPRAPKVRMWHRLKFMAI